MLAGEARRVIAALLEIEATCADQALMPHFVDRLAVETSEHGDAYVDIVFRQGASGPLLGGRVSRLLDLPTETWPMSPEQLAADIHDFLIVEPHDPTLIPMHPDGVRRFDD